MTQSNVIPVDFASRSVSKAPDSPAARERDAEDVKAALHELANACLVIGLDMVRYEQMNDGQLCVLVSDFLARLDGCAAVIEAVREQLIERLQALEKGAS